MKDQIYNYILYQLAMLFLKICELKCFKNWKLGIDVLYKNPRLLNIFINDI